MRNFQEDFCLSAFQGLNETQRIRVAIALDIAICFGALESMDGKESFKDRTLVETMYEDKVRRLAKMP